MKKSSKSDSVESIINFGPKSTEWLNEIGIFTWDDIDRIGVLEVFVRLKRVNPKISLNMLWALYMGHQGKHWNDITPKEKQTLKNELKHYGF
jgi:DNA transformation protein